MEQKCETENYTCYSEFSVQPLACNSFRVWKQAQKIFQIQNLSTS